MSNSDSGDPTPYDDRDEGEIETALDNAFNNWSGSGTPSRIRVTAKIEWSGIVDAGRGGVRRTKLDGLNLGPVKDALDKSRDARDKAADARPAESYKAKGWHAQLSALTASARGSDAADRAGLSPSARTVTNWLAETREPSKANQQKIATAYEALRTWRVNEAQADHKAAKHQLAEDLNKAIRDNYNGAEVRLRDISNLELE